MGTFTRSFCKIVPSLRESTMEIIRKNPVRGEQMMIPLADREIEIYLHRGTEEPGVVLFEFHGGGLVLGDAAKDDYLCERICRETGITVIGVNYRKAPEYPYPAAVQDAYDTVNYVQKHSNKFGIDPDRMAVMGFSAGATLATVTAMQAAEKKEFRLVCQILHYPYLDGVTAPASKKSYPANLPVEVMEAFTELYGNGEDPRNPYISPLYATREMLKGSAPTALFMAERDALCEEGAAYAALLRAAGVPVITEKIVTEMHHGYMEDYFNLPCYQEQPEDILALHSPKLSQRAEMILKRTEKILKEYLLKD